jgi:hypothetical protein
MPKQPDGDTPLVIAALATIAAYAVLGLVVCAFGALRQWGVL